MPDRTKRPYIPVPEEELREIKHEAIEEGEKSGTYMLKLLVQVARSMNIERLTAWVMAGNLHMLHIVQKSGLDVQAETRYGETCISVSI